MSKYFFVVDCDKRPHIIAESHIMKIGTTVTSFNKAMVVTDSRPAKTIIRLRDRCEVQIEHHALAQLREALDLVDACEKYIEHIS